MVGEIFLPGGGVVLRRGGGGSVVSCQFLTRPRFS